MKVKAAKELGYDIYFVFTKEELEKYHIEEQTYEK